MSKGWNIKYGPGATLSLTKDSGETAIVRVESVDCHKRSEPIYGVREVETAIGYPVAESCLRATPHKSVDDWFKATLAKRGR